MEAFTGTLDGDTHDPSRVRPWRLHDAAQDRICSHYILGWAGAGRHSCGTALRHWRLRPVRAARGTLRGRCARDGAHRRLGDTPAGWRAILEQAAAVLLAYFIELRGVRHQR